MWGRIIGLVAGVALLAEGYVLWRPESAGFVPSPDLGPFTQYRMIIALLAAAVGLMVAIASLLREPRKAKPTPADWSAEPAVAAATLVFAAEPAHAPPAAAPASEHASPPPASADHPTLDPFPSADPHELEPPAHEPEHAPGPEHEHDHEHDPHAEPEPLYISQPAPEPSAAPAQLPSGDRGAFLAAMDEGDQLRAANRLGDALDPYSEALKLARARLVTAPNDVTAKRDLACALTSVADVHDREGRLDSALDLHDESLTLRRALAAQAPDDLAAQRALSLGLEKLADTREARGHRSRARDLFRERLPLAERLVAAAPNDGALSKDLFLTRERLAELDQALAP